jgi:hypothetical protein
MTLNVCRPHEPLRGHSAENNGRGAGRASVGNYSPTRRPRQPIFSAPINADDRLGSAQ